MHLCGFSVLSTISGFSSFIVMINGLLLTSLPKILAAVCGWVGVGRSRVFSCFSDSSFLSHLASSFSSLPQIPATSHFPQFALCPWAQLLSLLHTCVWTSLFFCHYLLLLRAPHLSSARFLVWPIGLLPAPPTDLSTLFIPTYPPPACPYFLPQWHHLLPGLC